MGKLGRIRQVLRRLGAHAGRPGARSRYLLLALTVAAIVAPMLGVGAARAWHANGVTVSVTCDRASGTYQVSATIEQSQESPGAFVKNIEPSSFPGDTSGEQTVTVTIGWDNSSETQTFTETVTLAGDCAHPKPPTGTLVVIKHVLNDNGGDAVASDWTMHVSGPATLSFPGAEDPGTSNSVPAGGYAVSESGGPSGYTLSFSGDCDGSGHVNVPASGSATCVLTNEHVRSHPQEHGSISVSKSADPTTLKEPGGLVTFSVRITNTSADVNVTIQNVVDDKFGNLTDEGGNGCFDVPITLKPGQSVSCQFQEQISGPGGTTHTDTVTASGVDQNGNPVSGSDSATVQITPRLIDLVIVKQATSPTPLNGIVHYQMTVTNKGPDTATNVQLADPAPAGITYLSANPSQGTCQVTPSLITCSLGSIAPGQTVTIQATARATTVGEHVNTATVTGGGGNETDLSNNTASAVTVVPAPTKPPNPKPSPAPSPTPSPTPPQLCVALTVTPKMVKADGKPDRIVAKVTVGSRPDHGAIVLVRGAGVRQTKRTSANGVVVMRINPKKAGLITVSTPDTRRSCGPRLVAVVAPLLPPVAG